MESSPKVEDQQPKAVSEITSQEKEEEEKKKKEEMTERAQKLYIALKAMTAIKLSKTDS